MKIDCSTVIFDLDGTLSDPSLGIVRCFNHALQTHGFTTVSERMIEREIGPPLDETFKKLVPGVDDASVTELITSYRERYADEGYAENKMYPGVPDALKELSDSRIPLGVCTSKRADFAEKILSLFGLKEYFSFVDGGDVGITKASQLAGLLHSKAIDGGAVMVGDRAIDIWSAQTNGLRSIGVLWGFGDYAELSAASPSYILDKVEELPRVFIC